MRTLIDLKISDLLGGIRVLIQRNEDIKNYFVIGY